MVFNVSLSMYCGNVLILYLSVILPYLNLRATWYYYGARQKLHTFCRYNDVNVYVHIHVIATKLSARAEINLVILVIHGGKGFLKFVCMYMYM